MSHRPLQPTSSPNGRKMSRSVGSVAERSTFKRREVMLGRVSGCRRVVGQEQEDDPVAPGRGGLPGRTPAGVQAQPTCKRARPSNQYGARCPDDGPVPVKQGESTSVVTQAEAGWRPQCRDGIVAERECTNRAHERGPLSAGAEGIRRETGHGERASANGGGRKKTAEQQRRNVAGSEFENGLRLKDHR